MRVIIIIQKLGGNKVKYHIPQRKLFYTLISYTGKKPISLHIFAISNINITERTQIMCAMILENKLFKQSISIFLLFLNVYSLVPFQILLFFFFKSRSHNPAWPVVEDHFDFYLLLSLLSTCQDYRPAAPYLVYAVLRTELRTSVWGKKQSTDEPHPSFFSSPKVLQFCDTKC